MNGLLYRQHQQHSRAMPPSNTPDTTSPSSGKQNRSLVKIAQQLVQRVRQPSANRPPLVFTENRRKWHAVNNNPDTFSTYTLRRTVFSPVEFTVEMDVTEQNNRVVNATYTDSDEPVPVNMLHTIETIDAIFKRLQQAYQEKADTIEAHYDPEMGYPTYIEIGISTADAQEKIHYQLSDLEQE